MDIALQARIIGTMILMMGGIFLVVGFAFLVYLKIAARNKWYVEFNRNGQMVYQLLEDNEDAEIVTKHGTYYLPTNPRMRIGWPLGLPSWLQENVYHEKYMIGNPEPIEFPGQEEDLNLALYIKEVNQASKDVLVSVNESLAAFSGGKSAIQLYMMIGIGAIGVVALVAAYFAYQASSSQDQVLKALGVL